MIREAKRPFDLIGIYEVIKSCNDKPYFIHSPFLLWLFQKLKQRIYFVYIFQREVVGFVAVQNNLSGDLWVRPEHRNKGIGKKLRLHVEDFVLNKYDSLIVYSPKENYKYYLPYGYRVIETKKSLKGDIKLLKKF